MSKEALLRMMSQMESEARVRYIKNLMHEGREELLHLQSFLPPPIQEKWAESFQDAYA